MTINYAFLATNVISILVALGVPVALAVVLIRKYKATWWAVILTGFLSFAIGQVMFYFSIRYISTLLQNSKLFQGTSIWALVLYALLIGAVSAVFVELMRYAGFLLIKSKVKSFATALGFGIGGGTFSGVAQSFFSGGAGLTVLLYFFAAAFFNPGAQLAKGVDSATVQSMMTQIQQIWNIPWHYGLVLGAESLIFLSVEIVLAMFIWKAISYEQGIWVVVAVLYHTLVIGTIYFLNMLGWKLWLMEAVFAAFLAFNVYLIYRFWKEESEIEADEEFLEEDALEDGEEDGEVVEVVVEVEEMDDKDSAPEDGEKEQK